MGMNIYTLDGRHIGKRHAAGIWCWEHRERCTMEHRPFCVEHRMNLVENHEKYSLDCPSGQGCFVSVDQHQMIPNDMGFINFPAGVKAKIYWHCPKSKKHVLASDKIGFNPAQRELGFDKLPPRKHKGINGASGWTWALHTTEYETVYRTVDLSKEKFVVTEYDEKWPIKKFNEMFNDIIDVKFMSGDFS